MTPPELFRLEREPAAWVLELQSAVGSFRTHEASAELEAVLRQLAESAIPNVIVDFHNVPYFGSSLLEVLLAVWSEVQSRGGSMSLCNVAPAGREVLEVSRFDTLWPVHASRADAIEAVPAA